MTLISPELKLKGAASTRHRGAGAKEIVPMQIYSANAVGSVVPAYDCAMNETLH